ncbi:unnamed protein product, partial [Mycena citricolor]
SASCDSAADSASQPLYFMSGPSVNERFLVNRNTKAALRPFDGRNAAVFRFQGDEFLVTTLAHYVPAFPSALRHQLYLREDYGYGEDDFTRWPQQYSAQYCHLAAIRSPDPASDEFGIAWWKMTPDAFVTKSGDSTLTPGLGLLRSDKWEALKLLVGSLSHRGSTMQARQGGAAPRILAALLAAIQSGLERLRSIPTNLAQLTLSIARLQFAVLETDAIIQYMNVYHPRMLKPAAQPTCLAPCIGAYTSDPSVAQQFHAAGLPCWYIRLSGAFVRENIWELVEQVDPSQHLVLQPHPRFTERFKTSNNTERKISFIHQSTMIKSCYRDPFDDGDSARGDSSTSASTVSGSRPDVVNAPSRADRCWNPYKQPAARPSPKESAGRNKFEPLRDRPGMPDEIYTWVNALKSVDRSNHPRYNPGPRDSYYLLPEPALLLSPDREESRLQRIFHFMLLRDALEHRFHHVEDAKDLLLSSQEWREVLAGKVVETGRRETKSRQRTAAIEKVLAPALAACGIDGRSLPVPLAEVPPCSKYCMREIIWQLGQAQFRFELMALDRRASGLSREAQCMSCFPSRALIAIELKESKMGMCSTMLRD